MKLLVALLLSQYFQSRSKGLVPFERTAGLFASDWEKIHEISTFMGKHSRNGQIQKAIYVFKQIVSICLEYVYRLKSEWKIIEYE